MFKDSDGKVYNFDYTFAPYVGTVLPRTRSTYSYRQPPQYPNDTLDGLAGLGAIPRHVELMPIYARIVASVVTGNLRFALFQSVAIMDEKWDVLVKTERGKDFLKYRLTQLINKVPVGERLALEETVNKVNAIITNILVIGIPGGYVWVKEKVEEAIEEVKKAGKYFAEEKEDFMKMLMPLIVGVSVLGMGLVLIPMFTKKKKGGR